MVTSIDILSYEPVVRYAQKDPAWTVLKDIRNRLQSQNKPSKLVLMKDNTIYADPSVFDSIEKIVSSYSFRTKKIK